ncbi:cobalt-zinc-cadmium efflux system outer membrane protein [Sphingomonas jinjuensis]|uniref:Cobalt-zinc-cadmium efflux system outer membrane protein n=2 Tax=Sphingomonas jinjuensis TaxID=535907 RepID=A0A840F929_9SPHN|nr:cobalt-zinc-cadmium efflux system outer membrane protein [Sphingomonas jinjuensis]
MTVMLSGRGCDRMLLLLAVGIVLMPAATSAQERARPPAPAAGMLAGAPVVDGQAIVPITLESALDAADRANIDVITARLAVRTARANLRSADTAPNPVLSLNAVQLRPGTVGTLPVQQLSDNVVRVDLPLERGGKRRARVGAAQAGIDAAEGDLGDARRQMRVAVSNAYFTLKAAEQRLSALTAIASAYDQAIGIARKQQRAGALSEGDLVRQQVEGLRARTDASQAITDRQDAQLALASLIGQEANAAALATTGDWPTSYASSPLAASALAARRPDVLAANARVQAARRNLDGAHALRHPDITVGAQFESAPRELGVGDSVGFGVSIPLPLRNRYNGEVDAAGVALIQAEAQARRALAVATAEIETARRVAAEAAARRQLVEGTQLPAARRAADIANFAYGRGAMTLLEVLDARRSLQAVELSAIDARTAEAQAIARLRSVETTGNNE